MEDQDDEIEEWRDQDDWVEEWRIKMI